MILVDSSYFVALADRKDRWHVAATELDKSGWDAVLVSDLIVAESVTIVGSRGRGKAAQRLYSYFVDSCELSFVDKNTLDRAMKYHLQYDGSLSVADCTSIVIMQDRGIRRIVSFDTDFDRVKGIERIH